MKFTGERYIPGAVNQEDEINHEHLNRYTTIVEVVKGKSVLDAACGSGYGSFILSEYANSVHGIDIDEETINYAQKKFHRENINFDVSSVTSIPYKDNSFDVIVSFETIEHLDEKNQSLFLKEIKRVLRKGGQLLMSTPDKSSYSDKNEHDNQFHLKEFYPKEFNDFLKAHFKNVYFLYQRNEVCNLISSGDSDRLEIVRKNENDSNQGKYLIAVCSNANINKREFASAQIQTGKHDQLVHRIYELQEEVEEKNKWAFSLNDEIDRLRGIIENEQNAVNLLRKDLNAKEQEYVILEKELKVLDSKSEETLETKKILQQELSKAHISNSLKEKQLSNIQVQIKEQLTLIQKKEKELNSSQIELAKLNKDLSFAQEKQLEVVNSRSTIKKNLEDTLRKNKNQEQQISTINGELQKALDSIKQKEQQISQIQLDLKNSKLQVNQKEQKILNLKSEIDKSLAKLNLKNEELHSKQNELATLKKDLDFAKAEKKQFVDSKSVLRNKLESSNKSLKEKEEKLRSIEVKLKIATQSESNKQKEVIDLKSKLDKANDSLSEKTEETVDLQSKLHATVLEKEKSLTQKDTDIIALQNEIKHFKLVETIGLNSKKQLESELEKAYQLISKNERHIAGMQSELNSAKKTIYSKEIEIVELYAKIANAESLLGNKETQLAESYSKLTLMDSTAKVKEEELNSSLIELAILQKDLEYSFSNEKDLKKSKNNLKIKLKEASVLIQSYKSELKTLKLELETLNENSNRKEKELDEAKVINSQSVQRILDLQDEVEEKNNWAFSLNDEIVAKNNLLKESNDSLVEAASVKDSLANKLLNIETFNELKVKHLDHYSATLLSTNYGFLSYFRRRKEIQKSIEKYHELQFQFNQIPSAFLEQFRADQYLQENADVNYAIERGDFDNALEHFILFGYNEVKTGQRKLYNTLEPFNEEDYLAKFSDVKPAIEQGIYSDVFESYLVEGIKRLEPKATVKEVVEDAIEEVSETITPPSIEEVDGLRIVNPEHIDLSVVERVSIPKYDQPLVSIIVPAYNQANYTFACIKSIILNTLDIPYEVILIDDNSPAEDAANIEEQVENLVFIRNEENLGFLKNCNKAATYATGKYILFLNNDTNVQPNWLNSLVELIESNQEIGMVGSRLVYPDGRQQEAGGIIWNDASGWNFGRLDDRNKAEYNYVKEVDYISGAAIMISLGLWKTIGGFDERFVPAYYEDTDLAFEVRKHGYKVMYQPKSLVVHFEGVSNGTDISSGIKKYQQINFEKFFTKWKDVLQKDHYENAKDVFLSRDRSQTKKHLLFVDHYLPHYDQDAGSKAAFQYLQLLTKSNIQVHFIGDNFWHYPDTPYHDALTNMGIEVLCGNWYANNWQDWLKENGKYFDYVLLSRPHISEKYIDLVKEFTKAKVIYFGHDLHFLREEREYEIKGEEKYLESSASWKKKELDLINKSDVSYFFSDVEKQVILSNNKDFNVNVVPLYIFDQFKKINYAPKSRKDIMFVGGFSHAPNTDAVKWFVSECWPSIKEQIEDIHFHVIGSNPPQEIIDLAGDDISVTGYIGDKELNTYYNTSKLAIAPLRYGAGVKGKVIDALYQGIPLITTSIGAEGLHKPEEIMGVADNAKDFTKLVCDYYTDSKLLSKLSKKSNQYCQKFFSEAYAKEQMAQIIPSLK